MTADPAEAMRRVGFRKWYERQLLASHAHMALAFLSIIALVASIEAYRGAQWDARQVNALFALLCAGIGLWALRRYVFLLVRAEAAAHQASCPGCGDYGRFRIVRHRADAQEIDVHCDKCSRDWMISGLE